LNNKNYDKGKYMPIINVKMTKEDGGASKEQKEILAKN
jgi:phenylpyruvate tautomerase PptA (4-oxalocrotonate tautomerase family)